MTLIAGAISESADLSDVEFLAQDEPKKDETPIPKDEVEEKEEEKEEETEETPEEEPEEESEEEEESTDETEEEKDEVPEDSKAIVDKLRTVDPQIFKKIPALRSIIYTQKEYSKLFSDPNEAREVLDDYQSFSQLSSDILAGNAKSLLDAVGSDKSGALDRFAKNFLPALHGKNPDLFVKVGVPLVNGFLRNVLKQAESTQNKNLALAAKFISRELNGTADIPDDKKVDDPEKKQLQEQIRQREQQDDLAFQNHATFAAAHALSTEIDKRLSPTIKGLQREAIAERIDKAVREALSKDPDHNRVMNSLWKRAKLYGRDPEIARRLSQAFITKSKEILPSISTKILADFFPKASKSTPKKQFPSGGGGGTSKDQKITPQNVDYRKSSDRDILEGRATLKK